MKKLEAKDFFSLKYGDKVYLRKNSYTQDFRYVGRMPSSPDRYLIFSCGETLKHLYIREDDTFNGEWFSGDYDDDFFIRLEINSLKMKLQSLEEELKISAKKI